MAAPDPASTTQNDIHRTIDAVWRIESARLIAGLARIVRDVGERALELLQAKVDYFEHSGTIRDAAGQILMQLGKVEDAVAMFRTASVLSETDDSIRERLAGALIAHKD